MPYCLYYILDTPRLQGLSDLIEIIKCKIMYSADFLQLLLYLCKSSLRYCNFKLIK